MKSRLQVFKNTSLCCSCPRAAGWQNCSARSQFCCFVPFSAVQVWVFLTVFRYVTAPWHPPADATRNKILRPFQPSPGYLTGFSKLQGEDLQVSSENSVSPQLLFLATCNNTKISRKLRLLPSYCSSNEQQQQGLCTSLSMSTCKSIHLCLVYTQSTCHRGRRQLLILQLHISQICFMMSFSDRLLVEYRCSIEGGTVDIYWTILKKW